MSINFKNERYCHKCHKIKIKELFKKITHLFRFSGICKKCEKYD